ncbi:MAG: insulinase family protein, partial [Acidobacteriota bacterium]|nr:insulinase family protein [Acidobacteriota bacterium]
MRLSIARWATLLLAALPLAAQPAAPPALAGPAAASARVDIPYTQFSLPNGLNVIHHEDHTVPLVAVDVWYHVGSARETPGRTGLAHLFEHILFEGSK